MSAADGTGRFCSSCGHKLSRYNKDDYCHACVSAGRNTINGRPTRGRDSAVDGMRLAELRRERGWTQEVLADQAGISTDLVRKLEQNAKPSARISTLSALGQALDVAPGDLLRDRRASEPAETARENAAAHSRSGQPRATGRHSEPESKRPTLMRAMIAQRHWQRFRTFEVQFRRAARELAARDDDPDLAKLTISSRQWERWYSGNVKSEPHPDACRVLEHMFGYPVQQLLSSLELGDNDGWESAGAGDSNFALAAEDTHVIDGQTGKGLRQESDPYVALPLEFDIIEAVKRRELLMDLATSAGLGAAGAIAAREAIRHEMSLALAKHSNTSDVEEWREIVLEYGQTYPVTPPDELLKSLMADLHGLQIATRRCLREPEQRELRRVGAMLSAFTAQTVANLGHLREADRWWRTARHAADESEDHYAILWIRGREIVRAGYERRPVKAIFQLIAEVDARLEGRSPIDAIPEFLGGKAQTLAMMGRPAATDTEQTLIRLRETFSALPDTVTAPGGSIFTWGEERLRFTESLAYTYLGDFRSAGVAQDAALALYPADDLRSPAQIELQRALCLVNSGDVLSGVRHAQEVISELPAIHRVRPVADLGQKVLRAVPSIKQSQADVQEYAACLDSSFSVSRVPELTQERE
jgi:transcriptional regulator with XRE-family HTH domain